MRLHQNRLRFIHGYLTAVKGAVRDQSRLHRRSATYCSLVTKANNFFP